MIGLISTQYTNIVRKITVGIKNVETINDMKTRKNFTPSIYLSWKYKEDLTKKSVGIPSIAAKENRRIHGNLNIVKD